MAERTAQLEAANRELEAFSYSVSHDLLTLARASRHQIRKLRTDMTSFVRGAFAEAIVGLEPGSVTLLLDELPHSTCDPGLIRLVWKNLIENAIKFTAPKSERIVEVGANREEGRTVYHVRDNGRWGQSFGLLSSTSSRSPY